MKATGLIILLLVIFLPKPALAILPPDMILSVGAQVSQFFTVLSLVFIGVIGSVTFFIRTKFAFIQTYSKFIWPVLAFALGIALNSIYVNYTNSDEAGYLNYLQSLDDRISQVASSTEVHYPSVDVVPVEFATSTELENEFTGTKQFRSDAIFLYGTVDGESFYLDLDMNRRQNPDGRYAHYYYINGLVNGVDQQAYQSSVNSNSALVTGQYLTAISKYKFSDLSTRDGYRGVVNLKGKQLSFVVQNLSGDFITKNTPEYTRYQSVGEATVIYEGKEFVVQALAESIYSSDFSESIFFPGSQQIKADTYQFVLWDEQKNFYLIDSSKVYSDEPKYPSHTWLLYKNAAENYSKKSFSADLTASISSSGVENHWLISIPELKQGSINLSLQKYIEDSSSQTRRRALVQGEVNDSEGKRMISGFVQIIK